MIRYIQTIPEERYMEFDNSVYFEAGLAVPLFMCLFALVLVTAAAVHCIKAKKQL